jgi:microsomal dipeptidase-like Zn-dependent dipeptidase
LEADGWSKEDLAKLAGENILRVLSENEKVRVKFTN